MRIYSNEAQEEEERRGEERCFALGICGSGWSSDPKTLTSSLLPVMSLAFPEFKASAAIVSRSRFAYSKCIRTRYFSTFCGQVTGVLHSSLSRENAIPVSPSIAKEEIRIRCLEFPEVYRSRRPDPRDTCRDLQRD